jgi:hypothetical protein
MLPQVNGHSAVHGIEYQDHRSGNGPGPGRPKPADRNDPKTVLTETSGIALATPETGPTPSSGDRDRRARGRGPVDELITSPSADGIMDSAVDVAPGSAAPLGTLG